MGVPVSSSAGAVDDLQTMLMQYRYQSQYVPGNRPIIELYSYTGKVADISWSKNDFSASFGMDKTMCLWNATKKMYLRIFW